MSTTWDPDSPSLRKAIICYADILGFRADTERAFASGSPTGFLRRVKDSLDVAYGKVRDAKEAGGINSSIFDMKVFTDNIVVAYPVHDPDIELGEGELGTILMLFSEVQASLAVNGFLLRGAIAFGDHYQDDDIAFGPALLEAIDLDKSGSGPRLVIARSAECQIARQLTSYGYVSDAPHYDALLKDANDGRLFVNYLQAVFRYFPDDRMDYKLLAEHRDSVASGLQEYESNPRVRQKYEWVATYHNYVCQDIADRYFLQRREEVDPEQLAYSAEARRALEYLVPFNGLLRPPQRLDAK